LVVERAGLAGQAGEVEERDALQVAQVRKLLFGDELAPDRLSQDEKAFQTGLCGKALQAT
jgi:hypothetical protein